MNDQNVNDLIHKVEHLIHHVGTLEGSYPRILKNAPTYTRSHLIIFYETLPHLKHLLHFANETIPVITKILGLATEGKSDLEKASEHLHSINQSSETAVTEIFTALDQVSASLREAQQTEDDEQKKTIQKANAQLMSIMNALQFQDITSQKIEATNALLARLGDGLIGLIRDLGVNIDNHHITAREGTYDDTAAFDRETSGTRQEEIDDLLASNQPAAETSTPVSKPDSQNKQTPPKNNKSTNEDTSNIDQNDIDSIISATPTEETTDSETVAPDDIDSLIDSTQSEDATPVNPDDIDSLINSAQNEDTNPISTDDIDDLIDSAQSEDTTPAGPIDQDAIDALLND